MLAGDVTTSQLSERAALNEHSFEHFRRSRLIALWAIREHARLRAVVAWQCVLLTRHHETVRRSG